MALQWPHSFGLLGGSAAPRHKPPPTRGDDVITAWRWYWSVWTDGWRPDQAVPVVRSSEVTLFLLLFTADELLLLSHRNAAYRAASWGENKASMNCCLIMGCLLFLHVVVITEGRNSRSLTRYLKVGQILRNNRKTLSRSDARDVENKRSWNWFSMWIYFSSRRHAAASLPDYYWIISEGLSLLHLDL